VSPSAGGAREVLTVAEALALAREALDREVGTIQVRGEVSGYRGRHRSGHYYFALRDEQASMDVKMWSSVAARGLRCTLAEGRAVLVRGRFDIWLRNGRLSLILDEVEDLGAGDLARRFEELRQRLRAEGLFAEERKRPLPSLPRTVALVTAWPSAAAADFLRTLEEARAPVQVWLRPAAVQGAAAVPELVAALAEAARAGPDLVVLARGGGSLEDLWAFNEEALVRAVAACPVPVVNAVGHETDVTLADFAADRRAKTPTAAGALVAEGWRQARRDLLRAGRRLAAAAAGALEARRARLDRLARDLRQQAPGLRLARMEAALAEAETRLVDVLEGRLRRARQGLERLARRLQGASPEHRLRRLGLRLEGLGARLRAGNPEALLERGYALVQVAGRPGFLRRAADVAVGELLEVRLARGRLRSRVEEREET